ncbi:MAG TPA: hypothetical protein VFQ23_23090 [Anaerolineales bacterium]|nr:hypothetical protein [Anaerolineales bacterium]
MKLQNIEKEILGLCVDDDTGFWLIIKRIAKDSYSIVSVPESVRKKTMEVIRHLLQNQLIVAGNPNGPKFRACSLSTPDLIAYIVQEWDKLGSTPNIGDICWFRATPAGEKLARELEV